MSPTFVMYYGIGCGHCRHTLKALVLPLLDRLADQQPELHKRVKLVDIDAPTGEYARAYFLRAAPALAQRYGHTDTRDAPVVVTPVWMQVDAENPYNSALLDTFEDWAAALQGALT